MLITQRYTYKIAWNGAEGIAGQARNDGEGQLSLRAPTRNLPGQVPQ